MKNLFKSILSSNSKYYTYLALAFSLFVPFFSAVIEILSVMIPDIPEWVKTVFVYDLIFVSYFSMCLYLIMDTNMHTPKFVTGKSITPISFKSLIFLGIYIIICIECSYIGTYIDLGAKLTP